LTPWIPTRGNLRTFFLGGVWFCAGGLVPALMELWEAVTTYQGAPIEWPHIAKMAAAGSAPLAIAYWRKYRALIQEPPKGENDASA